MAATATPRLTPDQVHRITLAIADPRRFAILQQIAAAQTCLPCSALAEHASITPATISHHMKTLQEAGHIDITRNGRSNRLTLRRATWTTYLQQLAEL